MTEVPIGYVTHSSLVKDKYGWLKMNGQLIEDEDSPLDMLQLPSIDNMSMKVK